MQDPHARHFLDATVEWLGMPWSERQTRRLERYRDWLATEGARLGGIGPGESDRLWPRHLCDALLFGRGFDGRGRILDVGSGVGLPGIPLAIAFPKATVTMIDRSGRRVDAMRRVSRILELDCEIVQGDVAQDQATYDRVTFRASLVPRAAVPVADVRLRSGGEAWIGLGWGARPPARDRWHADAPRVRRPHLAFEEVEVPPEVLDSSVWLLRIRKA